MYITRHFSQILVKP